MMALARQEQACNDIAIIKQEQADPNLQTPSEDARAIARGQEDEGQQEVVDEDNELDSKPLGPEDSCDLNPEFAVICSFIIQFGDKIDVELDIERLKSAIEDQSSLDEELINIHVKLLKKLRRYFVRDQWEKALIRFASEYSYEHAYEIESFGYQKTRPSVKLELLRRLLDVQFQCDQKFKAAVNLCEADELRFSPLGRDIKGNTYWKKDDKEGNFKLFREEPLDYKSWKNICSNVMQLKDLIDELERTQNENVKGEPMLEPYDPLPEIFPEYFKLKEETPKQQTIEDKIVSSSKKSRHKGRKKVAPNGLPVLEEENSILVKNESNSFDTPREEDGISVDIKHQIKLEKYSQEDTANIDENAISSSTESQVKSTLENILTKVVASIEYIIRPLSRNSNEFQTNEVGPQQPTRKKSTPRTKRVKVKEEVLPRRASSRIQQLQVKKQAEQEEEMKKMIEREQRKAQLEIISQDEDSKSRTSNKNGIKTSEKSSSGKRRKKAHWQKGRGKKRLSWDKDDSDLSSASSASESDDDFEDANDFSVDTDNFDDEFACEEEDANIEPVIIRRARTARQSMATSETGDLDETTIVEEDKPCGRCDKSNDPEWILLCDMCDGGYHTSCTLPPLMVVPDGDWYCPSCEHKMLMTKLTDFHQSLSQILIAKEEDNKKKRQIASRKKAAAKVEAAPIVQEPANGRRAKDILNELNDPIALQRLDECLGSDSESTSSSIRLKKRSQKARGSKKPKSHSSSKRPKKTARRHYSDSEEFGADDYSDEIAQLPSEDELPKTRRARNSVSYKFKEFDALIKSAIRDDSQDEETSEEDDEPVPHNYGRGKDMATIEALAYQQENGLVQEPVASSKPSKIRRKGRRLNDLDALSEAEDVTSDESFQASATEAEDAELTEEALSEETETSIDEIVGSLRKKRKKLNVRRNSYESDDSDYQPNRSRRRATAKKFSYAESSAEEEEGSDFGEPTKKAKKTILSSDDETDASWKSDPTKSDEDDDEDPPTPFGDDLTDEGEEPEQREEVVSETHSSPATGNLSLDESVDEIAAPLYRPKQIVSNAMTSDPINQLNQYCLGQESGSTMYNSFSQILSKDSPPHPPFYGDDDPKQGANDKQKKSVEQTIPSH